LWSGNVVRDGSLKYVGASNDRDPILVRIGSTVPTNVVNGYYPEDCNLDGSVKYVGAENDRDPVLINVGGIVPTSVRVEQLP
jgi:alpha-glucosidase (family GH31 glycosyl hydrolase)